MIQIIRYPYYLAIQIIQYPYYMAIYIHTIWQSESWLHDDDA
jgi:hypothetical protein